MKNINLVVKNMARSGIRIILDEANKYDNVLHLEIGQPDFSTPAHIIQAAHKAALEGYTGYTPNAGYGSLREAFTERLEIDHNITVSPDQVVVSVGAMGALFDAFGVLVTKEDEVLVPDPGYPNYQMAINFLNAKPVSYPLRINSSGFFLDPDVIKSLISKRTKAIVINSPSNPTGFMLDEKSLSKIIEIAYRFGIYIISDEAYDHIVFDKPHISPLSFGQNNQLVSIFSCSKTYAMTGWRVGFIVSSREISKLSSKLQEAYVSCAPSISQKAAEAALRGPQDCVEQMNFTYKRRRDIAMSICDSLGIHYVRPSGAFYLMVLLPASYKNDSMNFALDLVRNHKLAVAPGITFGKNGAGYIRLALCASEDTIREGLFRLSKVLKY